MVVEYIRYTIDEGRRAQFETAYARARAALEASEHCLGFELTRGSEDPSSYVVRIEWDSLEGHMQGFRSSGEFGPFFEAIGPYVHDIAEMRDYELVA
jgi:heme-degrading monooxygenase HmoA